MHDIILPDYTLRGHKGSITALQVVLDWQEFPVPVLFSADTLGKLIIWDLITRRILFDYEIDKSPQVVSVKYLGNSLFSILSKDHKLRVLQLTSSNSTKLVKKGQSKNSNKPSYQVSSVFTVPVNTLNFANFSLQQIGEEEYRLTCCNTQDPERIDVYDFKLHQLNSLKRIKKGLSFYEIVKQFLNNSSVSKFDKLGIVMKFVHLNGLIYCGLESGFVICFKLHPKLQFTSKLGEVCNISNYITEPTGNSGQKSQHFKDIIEIVHISMVHYPNPILDMTISQNIEDTVISSSTESKVGLHCGRKENSMNSELYVEDYFINSTRDIIIRKDLEVSSKFYELPTSQIGSVASLNKNLIVSNWNGITLIVDEDQNVIKKYFKTQSNTIVNESATGNIQGDSNPSDKKNERLCKAKVVTAIAKQREIPTHLEGSLQIGQKRRLETFLRSSWCFIGYDDGCIALNQL